MDNLDVLDVDAGCFGEETFDNDSYKRHVGHIESNNQEDITNMHTEAFDTVDALEDIVHFELADYVELLEGWMHYD